MPAWLPRRAADHPDSPALIAPSGDKILTLSYANLHTRVMARARRLAMHGIQTGHCVAVLLPNGPSYVEMVHALTYLRAILVPVNLRLAPAEIAWQLARCRARLLVHDATTGSLAAHVAEQLPTLLRLLVDDASASSDDATPATAFPEDAGQLLDLAAAQCLLYTSGTSGQPKGALLTYGNFWWSAIGSALNLGLHGDDRWLACLPLFHVGGLSILMRAVIYGIPVVFPTSPATGPASRGLDLTAINQTIDEQHVTIISVVSTMLARMLEARGERPFPASLRCVLLGGGPAPRPLLEACARRGVPVAQSYGLTETTSQVATLAPADALRKLGSAGRPILPTELRIDPTALPLDGKANIMVRESAGTTVPLQEGEILVRGPTVSPGYLPSDGDPATPLPAAGPDGWLRTGDIGYLDADGYLFVLDRRTDLIISGGENVYPAEVEAILLTHPAIAEAAVYGMPDPQWGQRVAAAIVIRPDRPFDETDLLAFMRERLAGYKVPSRIRLVEALPRNATGKLLRRALREDGGADHA
jgi:O-succinylbenzoic acid--CoA ligase